MRGWLLISLFALGGCASAQPLTRPVRVEVPAVVPCVPPVVDHPVWPTRDLSEQAGIFEMVRALVAEVVLRDAYERRLRAALAVCGGGE